MIEIKTHEKFTKKMTQDIEDTPFYADVEQFRFYFTSAFYLNNFKDRFNDKLEVLSNRLQPYLPNPHKTKITGLVMLNAFNLYQEIEKRGYKVYDKEKGITIRCLETITINLQYSHE